MCRSNEIKMLPSLALVVPCYNEAEIFTHSLSILKNLLNRLIQEKKIDEESYILFIDDGSHDKSWQLIKEAVNQFHCIQGIRLSRNCGHQMALIAGLSSVDTDICISIDADLQDDVQCIEQMIEKYKQGNEVVYGVRNDRKTDSFFKRSTANLFYQLMQKMGVEQVANHADYRLLSHRALKSLLEFKERNVYIRGLIPLLGYKQDKVFYTRSERLAGESKYPFRKMLNLALEGITSCSITPLRIISMIGILTCFISVLAIFYILIEKLMGCAIQGWTSLIISIFFLGGVQLLSLGIIGEYIGKIYMEVKKRPKFFIEETVGN